MNLNPVICKNAENALCLFAVKTAAIFIKMIGTLLSVFSISKYIGVYEIYRHKLSSKTFISFLVCSYYSEECDILSTLNESHDARVQIENDPSKPSIIYALLGVLRLMLACER